MTKPPESVELFRAGFARILDAAGVVLLLWLGFSVLWGGTRDFLTAALWVGTIGALASLMQPAAVRHVPVALWAYSGIALVSAAWHRWPAVSSSTEPWAALFTPAVHLVVMVVFVAGAAYLLRTPRRLAALTVLLTAAIIVVAAQMLFDRMRTNFIYTEGGSVSLPSVAHWGGMHQIGVLLVIAFPLVTAVAFSTRSTWRMLSGAALGAALLAVAVINGSRSAIATMIVSAVVMGVASFASARAMRWRPRTYMLVAAVVVLALWYGLASVNASRPLASLSSNRWPIWTAAVEIVRDHPWLGVGPGNYSVAMVDGGYAERFLPRYAARRPDAVDPSTGIGTEQAHNMVLHVAAETGVAGAVSLLALWAWLLIACWRSLVRAELPLVSLGLFAALAAFLLRSLYDNFLDSLVTMDRMRVLVWLLFGAALALHRRTVVMT